MSKRQAKRRSAANLDVVLARVDRASNNHRKYLDKHYKISNFLHGMWAAFFYLGGAVLLIFGYFGFTDPNAPSTLAQLALFMLIVGVLVALLGLPLTIYSYFNPRRGVEWRISWRFELICGYLTSETFEWNSTVDRGFINSSIGRLADSLGQLGRFMNVTNTAVLARISRVSSGVRAWQEPISLMDDRRATTGQLLEEVVSGYIDFLTGRWQDIADGEPTKPPEPSPWASRRWVIAGITVFMLGLGLIAWQVLKEQTDSAIVFAGAVLFTVGNALLTKGGAATLDLKGAQDAAKGFLGPASQDEDD